MKVGKVESLWRYPVKSMRKLFLLRLMLLVVLPALANENEATVKAAVKKAKPKK